MSPSIRSATTADAASVVEIYNWYIANTVVTFEVDPLPASEMAQRMKSVLASHEWLLLERGSELLGYAYAGRYHARAAYRFTTESTIYLRDGAGGQGFGTQLYGELIRRIFARGYRSLVGGIALPNDASVRLHEKLGYAKVGHLVRVGHKFERWIDVGYWQLEARSEASRAAATA
jgi:phosphinothricin acetyltransferase